MTGQEDNVRRLSNMIEDAISEACRDSLFRDNDSLARQVDAYVADVRANPHAMGVTRELVEDFDIEEARRTGIIDMVVTWQPVQPFITFQVPL